MSRGLLDPKVDFVFVRQEVAREWLRPSQGPPGVLKFSSGKLMLKHEFVTIFFVK